MKLKNKNKKKNKTKRSNKRKDELRKTEKTNVHLLNIKQLLWFIRDKKIYCFTPWEFFMPVVTGGLSLESK